MKRILLFLLCCLSLPAAGVPTPPTPVTGKVVFEDGQPAPGVLVLVKHGTARAATDTQGHYSIPAQERDTLLYRFLGCAERQIPVAGRRRIDVVMQSDTTDIKDVKVVAGDERSSAPRGESPGRIEADR